MEIRNEPPLPASTIINIFSLLLLCPQPHFILFYSFLYWSIFKHILQFHQSHSSLQYLAHIHFFSVDRRPATGQLQCSLGIKLVPWP